METIVLVIHISMGTLAVFSGILGLSTKKGGLLHRKAGNVFFISMLIQAFSGFVLAMADMFIITAMAGIFTCYLVATAWSIVRSRPMTLSRFDYVAPLFAFLVCIVCGYLGLIAQNSDTGSLRDIPFGYYYFFATLGLIAGSLDLRLLYKKGLKGAQRLARHIWRMCFALSLSLGSFVEQGVNMIPDVLLDAGIAMAPDIVLVLMLYFLLETAYKSYRARRKVN